MVLRVIITSHHQPSPFLRHYHIVSPHLFSGIITSSALTFSPALSHRQPSPFLCHYHIVSPHLFSVIITSSALTFSLSLSHRHLAPRVFMIKCALHFSSSVYIIPPHLSMENHYHSVLADSLGNTSNIGLIDSGDPSSPIPVSWSAAFWSFGPQGVGGGRD